MDPVIERAQAGDENAFRELYRAHRAEVARVVQRTLGPSADVEDVIQEVFVQVFRSLRKFRGESKFSTWLFRVAWNVARMHIRHLQARPRYAPERPYDDGPEAPHRPDEDAERGERFAALYRLLAGLSEKKSTVLILHDFHGMSPAEIGEMTDTPVLTVRTRLFYARKELYQAIADDPVLGPQVEALMESLPGRPEARIQAKPTQRESSP